MGNNEKVQNITELPKKSRFDKKKIAKYTGIGVATAAVLVYAGSKLSNGSSEEPAPADTDTKPTKAPKA